MFAAGSHQILHHYPAYELNKSPAISSFLSKIHLYLRMPIEIYYNLNSFLSEE